MKRILPSLWPCAFLALTLAAFLSSPLAADDTHPKTGKATAQAPSPQPSPLGAEADGFYRAGAFDRCGPLYLQAAEQMPRFAQTFIYNAACCFALAGQGEDAFVALDALIQRGYRDLDYLQKDSDLNSLHTDPRWGPLQAQIQTNVDAYAAAINRELYELFVADQADRQGDINWEEVAPRDAARLSRVKEIVAEGGATHPDDLYHAALVLQHGGKPEDYEQARALAEQAAKEDPHHWRARWLSAAAHDRYLWSIGEPQVYGTQYKREAEGVWTMEPFDQGAVTDAERRAKGVPTLAESKARLDQMNNGS